jgi:polysaccharide export outer membrane protein
MGRGKSRIAAASIAIVMAVLGCANLGGYVWASSLPDPAQPRQYRLAQGDVLNVRVFNHNDVSGRVRVRPDGHVTIPLVNDVEAAGKTTEELAKHVERLLGSYIKDPVVTVSLDEAAPARISVLGEVARPGVYPLESGQGVLRALAAAGGLTEFAHTDRIFVVRSTMAKRIRFTMDGLSTPEDHSSRFRLENDDVVLVK